jgi:hypothetical protein
VLALAAAVLLIALPESEQYARASLPVALAELLGAKPDDGVYGVRRFRDPGRALWVIAPRCPEKSCSQLLFLEDGKGVHPVGHASGELVDADPEAGLPTELSFHVRGSGTETLLQWRNGRYEGKEVPRWFRDPLTRERVDAAELRARGLLDLKEGRFTAAAGRYALLCQDPCAVLEVETLAAALLKARLFPQAEVALRRAVEMKGHQARDLESLASLLRAQGRNSEASEIEARAHREADGGG